MSGNMRRLLEARAGRPEYESGKQARQTLESNQPSSTFVIGGEVVLVGAAANGQGFLLMPHAFTFLTPSRVSPWLPSSDKVV